MPCRLLAHLGYGKFHGAKLVLGLVAQQLQLRGTQDKKRGNTYEFVN